MKDCSLGGAFSLLYPHTPLYCLRLSFCRGMAVRDENVPHGLRLWIEDYPFAMDGLLVWSSIEEWVREYVSLYYSDS